jgi:uncharacterized delta-60 repeat protein
MLAASGLRAELIVDSSFRPPSIEQPGSITLAVAAPDGKVFIAGEFASVSGQPRQRLARVLPDGRLDPTFDAGLVDYVTAMLPLSDGRLLAASRIRTVGGQLRTGVLRLQTNGAVDLSFNGELPTGLTAYALALAPGDKVLAAGAGGPRVARLQADGIPDPSFQVGSGFDGNGFGGQVNALAVQPDGKVYVGGHFYYYDGQFYWPMLVRLNSNGTLDPSFDPAFSFWHDDSVFSLALRPDGKLWAAGKLEQVRLQPDTGDESSARSRAVALLLPNGSLDSSFTNLMGHFNFVRSMAVGEDGRLAIQGEFFTINEVFHPSIARLNTNGSLDPSFNPPMTGSHLAAYPGGRTLLCEVFHRSDGWSTSVVRLNADGTVDESFRVVAGSPAEITAVKRQRDGKLLVAGGFQLVDCAPFGGVLRLNSNGSRDTNFNAGAGPDGSIAGVAELTNGQILVAGSFTAFNGHPCKSLCRLHSDGRFDEGFNLTFGGVGFWDTRPQFKALAQTGDGRITLTGIFSGPRYNLMRMNADASVDDSFTPIWGFPVIYPPHFWSDSLLMQDGKLFVGGAFSDCGIADEPCQSDQNFGAIVRFDPTGTPDLGFDPLTSRDYSSALRPLLGLPNGSLLAIGGDDWWSYLKRLHRDGSLDPVFEAGLTAGGGIRSGLALSNGLIVVAGSFLQLNGTPRHHLARLHANGSLDSCFNPGPSVDGTINGVLLEPNGQWLLFGAFSSVAGMPRTGIAQVRWEDFCLRVGPEQTGSGTGMSLMVLGPKNRVVRLEMSINLTDWTPVLTNTLSAETWQVPITNTAWPRAFYRVVMP